MNNCKVCLDVARILECLGLDDYSIDYETCTVYLPPREYERVAEYFSKSLMSCEFEEGGWRWICE